MQCSHNTSEKMTWKNFSGFGILAHGFCATGAMLSQQSYESHMRAVVCGLALKVQWT